MVEKLKSISKSTWIKLGVAIAILLAVCFSLSFAKLSHLVTVPHVIQWVKDTQANGWTMLIFYVIFSVAVLALPITLFPIIGGVLFGFWTALPLNILAATMGSWFAFMIARFFGRDAIQYFLKGKLKFADEAVSQQGLKAVFILRWVGIPPFVIANYLFGISSVKVKDYLLGTLGGVFPWMAIVTYSAHTFWQAVLEGGEKGLRKALWGTMGPLVILSLFILITVGLSIYFKKRGQLKLTAVQP